MRGTFDSYDQFVVAHRQKLMGFVLRLLRNHQDAEDVCQETLIAAWKGLHRFRGDCPLINWVCVIARRECLTFIRARKLQAPLVSLEELHESISDPGPSLDSVIGLRLAAERFLKSLSPKDAVIWILHRDGLTAEEIEQRMPSLGIKHRQIHRRIKERLEPMWSDTMRSQVLDGERQP